MTTRQLAAFTANLRYEDLSEFTVRKTKQCILDWFGIAIRGSQETPSTILRDTLFASGGARQATVFSGASDKTSALQAAFLNGAASHSLDFDDLHNPSIIHLACVVVPPVFAIGEAEHKSGRDMIAGVVAGYEVGARVGEAVIPESYFFWHTTGTAGTFGAGASAARTLGLNEEQTLNALGSAGTQAAGLWEFLKEGAMSKVLHAGKSSYAGVLSAYISKAGFTGASKIMEGEKGFCRAMVAEPHLEKLEEDLGKVLKIDDNSFKPYACCKHSHASLYAMQTLRKENNLTMDDIEGIELRVNHITNFLINNPAPQNPYGGKFSIQYCVAGMMKWGEMGVEQFSEKAINDPDVRALMEKITVTEDPEIQAIIDSDASKLASKLILRLKDGRELSMLVEYPLGDPPNPMTWEDTVAKFMSLATPVYGEEIAEGLVNLIDKLDEVEDFSDAIANVIG